MTGALRAQILEGPDACRVGLAAVNGAASDVVPEQLARELPVRLAHYPIAGVHTVHVEDRRDARADSLVLN